MIRPPALLRALRVPVFLLSAVATIVVLPGAAQAGGLVNPFQPYGWSPYSLQYAGQFGFAVAPAGDINGDGYGDVLVGAFGEDNQFMDEGRTHVFLGSPTGPAPTSNRYHYPNQVGAAAGLAVSSAGDVNDDGYADYLVGVPLWNTQTEENAGKVMVYHGGTSLPFNPATELFSPAPAANQQFGRTVAPAGDVNGDGYDDVVVGTPYYAEGGFSARGAAWVFHGGPSGLSMTPARTWIGPAQDGYFGALVSPAGDVNGDGYADILVGAPSTSAGFAGNGAAHLFLGSAAGVGASPDTVVVGSEAGEALGSGVANAGDVNGDGYADVLLGSPGYGANNAGRCRIVRGGPDGFASEVFLGNSEVAADEYFGRLVATAGDIDADGFADVLVTSRNTSGGSRGRVVVFRGGRNGMTYVGDILTPTPSTTGYFGNAICGSGDTDGDGFSEILVGTEDWSIAPSFFEGRVFSYVPPRSQPRLDAEWPLAGPQVGTGFGKALAILPQTSGTTYPTFHIGDPGYDGTGRIPFWRGNIFGGLGNAQGGPPLTVSGSTQGLGAALIDPGDVNRDGYTDFVHSSITADAAPWIQAGRVDFRPGSINDLAAPVSVLAGQHDVDRLGTALAGRGDVNGDGYHDFVVGARQWDSDSFADCGRAWLVLGSATGPVVAPWFREGTFPGAGVGSSVALGDFDGDGFSDVVVGSSVHEGVPNAPSGRVEVFYGGPGGPPLVPGLVLTPLEPETSYGRAVASLGDVNADGIADLGVGVPGHHGHGAVFVYEGTLGRSQSNIPIARYEGVQDGEGYGTAIAGGGDVDGDGVGDFAIGAPGYDGGVQDAGRVELYYGAPLVPSPLNGFTFTPGIAGARLGEAIAPFNDVNLDGFADLAVGAPGGPGVAGRVYPFLGGNGPGHVCVVKFYEPNVANRRRVHPARLDHASQVNSEVQYASPGGRALIGVEYEVVTQNQSFTGVPSSATGLVHDPGAPDDAAGLLSSAIRVFPAVPLAHPGTGHRVRARFVTRSPFFPRSRWITAETHTSGDLDVWTSGAVVGVPPPEEAIAPGARGVTPNPARRGTASRIDFVLTRPGRVAIDVFDVRGARVARLLDAERPAGAGSHAWDGRDDAGRETPAGLYFAVVTLEGRASKARLVRL